MCVCVYMKYCITTNHYFFYHPKWLDKKREYYDEHFTAIHAIRNHCTIVRCVRRPFLRYPIHRAAKWWIVQHLGKLCWAIVRALAMRTSQQEHLFALSMDGIERACHYKPLYKYWSSFRVLRFRSIWIETHEQMLESNGKEDEQKEKQTINHTFYYVVCVCFFHHRIIIVNWRVDNFTFLFLLSCYRSIDCYYLFLV